MFGQRRKKIKLKMKFKSEKILNYIIIIKIPWSLFLYVDR